MLSTEEVTIAAMRRGRDGTYPSLLYVVTLTYPYPRPCRCDDVHECSCGCHLSWLLLGSLRCRL